MPFFTQVLLPKQIGPSRPPRDHLLSRAAAYMLSILGVCGLCTPVLERRPHPRRCQFRNQMGRKQQSHPWAVPRRMQRMHPERQVIRCYTQNVWVVDGEKNGAGGTL